MGRAGITYLDVANVAGKLASQGKNPTVDSVREALGGTGSKSTIAPLLKQWRAKHQVDEAAAKSQLPPALLQVVKALYEQLQAEADLRLNTAMEAQDLAQQTLRAERDTAIASLTSLQKDHDALQNEVAALKGQNETLATQNQALVQDRVRLEAEARGLEQRLADRQVEITSLHQQLIHSRQQFEHFQESMERARAEERIHNGQVLDRLNRDLKESQQQHVISDQLRSQLIAQLEAANREAEKRDDELAALALRNKELETNAYALQEEIRQKVTALERLKDLGVEIADLTGKNQQLLTTNANLEGELKALRRRYYSNGSDST